MEGRRVEGTRGGPGWQSLMEGRGLTVAGM